MPVEPRPGGNGGGDEGTTSASQPDLDKHEVAKPMNFTARRFDRLLSPIHWWIWRDESRRVQKLLRFGETETDGGRDLLRAAEVTRDPLLRRLYLEHAIDELHHGDLFRPQFWQETQERLRAGELPDIFPYKPERRLHQRNGSAR